MMSRVDVVCMRWSGSHRAQPVMMRCACRWQGAIESMRREVGSQFSDAACGRDVLQVGLAAGIAVHVCVVHQPQKSPYKVSRH